MSLGTFAAGYAERPHASLAALGHLLNLATADPDEPEPAADAEQMQDGDAL